MCVSPFNNWFSVFSLFQISGKKKTFFFSIRSRYDWKCFICVHKATQVYQCTSKKLHLSQPVAEQGTRKQNIVKEIIVTVNRVDHCGLTKCKSVSFISWILCQTCHTCGYCEVKKRSIVKSQIQSSLCYFYYSIKISIFYILCFYTSVTLTSYSSNRDIVLNQANIMYKTLLGTSNSLSGKCVCLICECTLCISHQNKTACHLPSTTQFVFVWWPTKKGSQSISINLNTHSNITRMCVTTRSNRLLLISIRSVALT